MASNYSPNRWELYNANIPNEDQPHSFITKRKLENIEKGLTEANIPLEVGEVAPGDRFNITITEDIINRQKKLNFTYPLSNIGPTGKSAYQEWLDLGNSGTKQEFIDSLKGSSGKDGVDGRDGLDGEPGPVGDSAYQAWISLGNSGSTQDFINSLKGRDGKDGTNGRDGIDGKDGMPGADGNNGVDGKSAYQLWLDEGNSGSTQDFIESLKGEDGLSAYEVWKTIPGNENKTITEFFKSTCKVEFVNF